MSSSSAAPSASDHLPRRSRSRSCEPPGTHFLAIGRTVPSLLDLPSTMRVVRYCNAPPLTRHIHSPLRHTQHGRSSAVSMSWCTSS